MDRPGGAEKLSVRSIGLGLHPHTGGRTSCTALDPVTDHTGWTVTHPAHHARECGQSTRGEGWNPQTTATAFALRFAAPADRLHEACA